MVALQLSQLPKNISGNNCNIMAKDELTVYEKIEKALFLPADEADKYLTPSVIEVKNRLMLCVSVLMAEPMKQDKEIVNFLMCGCGGVCNAISDTQAYRDVAALRKMVGSIKLSTKAWYRYIIIEGAKEGFAIAKTANDAKGMAACLDKIGKYTRADKEDEEYDYGSIAIPEMEPTDDVTVLEGLEDIPDLETERKTFRSLFKKDLIKKSVDVEPNE